MGGYMSLVGKIARSVLLICISLNIFLGFFILASADVSERQIRLKRGSEVGVVQKKVFTKRMRFEFTPALLGSIINEPFIDTYLYGFGISGHFTDNFGIETLYFLSKASDNALNRNLQNDYGKEVVAGKTKSFFNLNLLWTPIYGKLSLISNYILQLDTYFTAGIGTTRTSIGTSITYNVGMGQRFFVTKWLALRADIRNYLHEEKRGPIVINKQNLVVAIGTSIFFPARKIK